MIPQNFIQIMQVQCNTAASSLTKTTVESGDSNGTGFNAIFNRILNEQSVSVSSSSETISLSAEELNTMDPGSLIARIKKLLLTNGESLEDMFVGQDALEDLKNVLLRIGIDENTVESFFEKLSLDIGDNEIALSDLFSGLEEMDWSDNDENLFLEISMLPHLETVLSDMGLESSDISDLISDAKIEGTGIDLSVLLKGLKELQENIEIANDGLQQTAGIDENGTLNSGVKDFLRQLGVSDQTIDKGTVTLSEFVAGLEKIVNKTETQPANGELLKNDLEEFLAKVKIEKKSSSTALSFELSEEKLKTEMIRGGSEKENGGIFDKLMKHLSEEDVNAQSATTEQDDISFDAFGSNADATALPEDTESLDDTFVSDVLTKDSKKINTQLFLNRDTLEKGTESLSVSEKKDPDNSFSLENLMKEMSSTDRGTATGKETATQKSLPSYVINQVGRQLLRSINNGENEVKFQIKPPNLGRLQMTIDNSPDGFRISIIAEQNATKDLILAHSNELKTLMADQGLKIDGIDVNVSSDFQQAMSDANHQEDNSKKRGRHDRSEDDDINYDGILESGIQAGTFSYKVGGLDLLV